MTTIFSIHPAIGIARLGDSKLPVAPGKATQEAFFIGPEAPGTHFQPGPYRSSGTGLGNYRDSGKAIRRQGARFRIYKKEIDDRGVVVDAREVTAADATIRWKVNLANRKPMAERFPPYQKIFLKQLTRHKEPGTTRNYQDMTLRNFMIKGEAERRRKLVIADSGEVSSVSDGVIELKDKFFGNELTLANILTDESGRLIVLGGHGDAKRDRSDRAPLEPAVLGGVEDNDDLPADLQDQGWRHRLYNWDGWCDDTSDGIVSATLEFDDEGDPIAVESAWVIVAPPNFAPAVKSPVTLYDLTYSVIRKEKVRRKFPVSKLDVSFTRDVYPILRRTVDLQYADDRARAGHSQDAAGNFAGQFAIWASRASKNKTMKARFMRRMTRPGDAGNQIDMPDLFGGVDPEEPEALPPMVALRHPELKLRDRYGKPLTMTDYQFEILDAWAAHAFKNDWRGEPTYPEFDEINKGKANKKDQPAALDLAALEHCNGGSFHPGIEASFVMGRRDTFHIDKESWFRIAKDKEPGALTERLAVPWQHDFGACSEIWWPGQRPVSVPLKEQMPDGTRKYGEWFSKSINEYEDLLHVLMEFGFVKYDPSAPEGDRVFLDETKDEQLIALVETGGPKAKRIRELLDRIAESGALG